MRTLLNWSATSMKLATVGLCLATVGCGGAAPATTVQAKFLPTTSAEPVVLAAVVGEGATVTKAATAIGAATVTAAGDWGTIKGQILAGGAVTPLKLLVTKNDAAAKDFAVCAAQDVPDESLVVDAKTIDNIGDHELGQMLNYLRITRLRVGIILNFKRAKLEWKRVVL